MRAVASEGSPQTQMRRLAEDLDRLSHLLGL
jgi:hypothetical protein